MRSHTRYTIYSNMGRKKQYLTKRKTRKIKKYAFCSHKLPDKLQINKYTDQFKSNTIRHISSIDRRSIGGTE